MLVPKLIRAICLLVPEAEYSFVFTNVYSRDVYEKNVQWHDTRPQPTWDEIKETVRINNLEDIED